MFPYIHNTIDFNEKSKLTDLIQSTLPLCIFSKKSSGKKYIIRNILNIRNAPFELTDDKIMVRKQRDVTEYIITDSYKENCLHNIIENIKLIANNSSYDNIKTKIIVYNFEKIKSLHYPLVKSILNIGLKRIHYIFTSKNRSDILSSYCIMFKKTMTDCLNNTICSTFNNLNIEKTHKLKNIINDLVDNIFDINLTINDFPAIREMLFNLIGNVFDFTLLINLIVSEAVKKEPDIACYIVHKGAEAESKYKNGNKEIFYLEHFIISIINEKKNII